MCNSFTTNMGYKRNLITVLRNKPYKTGNGYFLPVRHPSIGNDENYGCVNWKCTD